MRVVVTGGAGFIGANLVRTLLARDEVGEVVAVDDLSTGSKENLDGVDGVTLMEGTILDLDLLDEACAGADAIVHLAARPSVPGSLAEPLAYHETNVTGTLNVLEAARAAGGAHVVLASSSAVYGNDPVMPKHEHLPLAPQSPYAANKLAAEGYARAYAASYDLPTLTFRFFNVFGPLQPPGHAYAAVIPAFLDALLSGRPLLVHGDGLQTRDFVFVDSVAAFITDAVERRVTHEGPVNLAFGTRHTLLDVLALLEEVLGREVAREHTPPRAGDVRDSQADQRRLQALFPDVEPIAFADGLRATIDWFRTLPQYR